MHLRLDERAQLLERFTSPLPPGELIDLLSRLGVSREMVKKATGAKSTEVIANWVAGRSAPRTEHFERLDSLRVVVSFLLQTNALDDEGLAIAMWLNSYPARAPFSDDGRHPVMTPLEALREGQIRPVVDAAQEWIDLREGYQETYAADEPDSPGHWSEA